MWNWWVRYHKLYLLLQSVGKSRHLCISHSERCRRYWIILIPIYSFAIMIYWKCFLQINLLERKPDKFRIMRNAGECWMQDLMVCASIVLSHICSMLIVNRQVSIFGKTIILLRIVGIPFRVRCLDGLTDGGQSWNWLPILLLVNKWSLNWFRLRKKPKSQIDLNRHSLPIWVTKYAPLLMLSWASLAYLPKPTIWKNDVHTYL